MRVFTCGLWVLGASVLIAMISFCWAFYQCGKQHVYREAQQRGLGAPLPGTREFQWNCDSEKPSDKK